VLDHRTMEQQKDDWLHMVANKTEEFKTLAMQELIGKKDFGDA
jgi:hypothetical protein